MPNLEIIDTHCHLYSGKLTERMEEVLLNAREAGVTHIYMPNVDGKSIESMLELEASHPHCKALMGLHPCSVDQDYKQELKLLGHWFKKRAFCGVGETGIDLYWDKTYYEEQVKCFEYQIDLSIDMGIPIIIHSRDSLDITIDIISKKQNGKLTGVFHCYNGSVEQTKKIVDIGFFMGLGGVITYKNSQLNEMVIDMPLNNMVLETDSPYLAPVPKRGKENEPAFLSFILEKVAEIRNADITEIAEITTANARKLYKNG